MSTVHALERRALSLGVANAIDYALQFLLPIVLTRTLDAEAFGRYRLLWLVAMTFIAIAPLYMPQSLYYFIPRSDRPTQRLYVNQTILFLAGMGLLAAWAVSGWNPLLPNTVEILNPTHVPLVPIFVLVWIVAALLDVLPTVDERVAWQSAAIVALSCTRTISLGTAALLTHSFEAVLWTLVGFAVVKLLVLVAYIATVHGLGRPWLRPKVLMGQVRHAAPFGLAGTLHGLRGQADQWVAAAVFPLTLFASFSIAAVLGPMVNLFRQSVNHVFLPSMSRLHSNGDVRGMLALNSRANAMVAVLAYPLLAFVFVFAEPLIELVYTSTYLDAVPVLRLYIVGLVAFVIELNSILLLLRQGAFAARLNALALAVSVSLSYWGATRLGLAGAAIGSIAAIYLDRSMLIVRIARITGEPVGRLQDWTRLASMLAASALAAALSGAVAAAWSLKPIATLGAGAALMAIAYPAGLFLLGQGSLVVGLFQRLAPTQPAPSGNN